MGDRANIRMRMEDGGDIYLYTHWMGTELPYTLQKALIRGRSRWTDEPYLTRIIFSEMIRDEVEDKTGYGIATYLCDGDDRVIKVNCMGQIISVRGKEWTFDDYISLTRNELREVFGDDIEKEGE